MKKYDPAMTVERMTVSLASELASVVREAAAADGQSVSSWIARAAERQLSIRGLNDVVSEWEALHGSFSAEELTLARKRLAR